MTHSSCSPDLIETFYQTYNDTSGSQQDRLGRCELILDALRTCGEVDTTFRAWSLLFEGILANERERDWGQGERLFRAALAAGQGHDLLIEARAALALGVTCHTLDRWSESIAFCRQALQALDGLDKPIDVASAWINMAIACTAGYIGGAFGQRQLNEGIDYCQQALAVLDSMTPTRERASLQASVYNTLGNLHNNAGHWHDAIAAYQGHLAICQEAGYRCRSGISYDNLGQVYEQMGEATFDQAAEAYQAALSIHQECEDPYLEALAWLSWAGLTQAQGQRQQALAHYLHAIDQFEALRSGISTAEARAGFFATVANAYAHAILLAMESGDVALSFDLAERSRSRAFLDTLFAGQPELLRRQEGETLSLADVQSALTPGALLLAFYTSGAVAAEARGTRQALTLRHRFPPPRTIVFGVTRDHVEVFDAGLSPNDLLPQRLQAAAERHFLQPAIRRTLYDRLLRPVAHLLAGTHRIYLVPHGPLHYVPFQALIASDGGTLLRPGGPELVYGPSASVLFRQMPAKSPRSVTPEASSTSPLAFGYNGDGPQRLRFAEDEARAVAVLLGGKALAGPAGKRDALFRQGPDASYLHISCHGEFDPESPLDSLLHLGAGETLTAHQVLEGLRLSCELVTLSACESGLSRVRRGDELMGLVRAFMVAGAPSVIATLWRVDERSTRILMERFYREVVAGAGFAQALREAQLYLRTLSQDEVVRLLAGEAPSAEMSQTGADRPFADPFYWAPFILVGAG
jgi:CHAT domain-containing protein/tetratricopeptide (TPR) repeat protein